MKYLSVMMGMVFAAGLFFAGQALGGEKYGSGHSEYGSSASQTEMESTRQMEQHQQQTAAGQLNREQVRHLQQTLNQKGFAAGQEDGVMGPQTKQALQNFQESDGLAATGEANPETLQALDIQIEKEEFFGLSPEFGEKTMEQEGQKVREREQMQEMEQEHQTPESEEMDE